MKKVLSLLLVIILAASVSFAQESETTKKNVIKVNPLNLIFGGINISYERVLFPSGALQVGLTFSSAEVTVNTTSERITGIGGSVGYRWYFGGSKDAPEGWYAMPRFQFSSLSDGSGNGINTTSIGAVAGYQWIWDGGFALDVFLGAQNTSFSTKGDVSGVSINGILPVIGVALGYSF